MPLKQTHTANLIDIENKAIYPAEISVQNGKIAEIKKVREAGNTYILPGFIDAHVHIESSMLVPAVFARIAVTHGTVATVSDPHEIGNVLGVEGVHYMINNGKKVNFKFNFGVPSCVPATIFETAGAAITASEVEKLLASKDIKYLAEMMNWPGVLQKDPEVVQKIAAANKYGKPVDGHAPGLRGEQAKAYCNAGISTDHECFTLEEALEKLKHGMKIIIREGSAAKNFEALFPLIDQFPDKVMFCSDDKHPDDLLVGHINQLVSRAVKSGANLFNVLQAACINPVRHYSLDVGLLKVGDPADFIILNELTEFKASQTYINGSLVAKDGKSLIPYIKSEQPNNFNCNPKKPSDFALPAHGNTHIHVIVPEDGQLVTSSCIEKALIKNGLITANPDQDTLKIAVVNRYQDAPPAVAFIKNFGLKTGAIASCVGHDSHNIIAVGTSDDALCDAVNIIIEEKGGICTLNKNEKTVLPLPVAGIMSSEDASVVAKLYSRADKMAKQMGSKLQSPFMTLSFMALLVIPALKLSDKGLFNAEKFEFTNVSTP